MLDREQGTISFSKNGEDLGVAFNGVPEEVLYPFVGMETPGAEVSAGPASGRVHLSVLSIGCLMRGQPH